MSLRLTLRDAGAMEDLGRSLAGHCPPGVRIHLQGELGAGKTTLVRGFLRGLGYRGNVKSPTYTLVEPYLIDSRDIYHFDLYRIADPEELEAIGLRDYLDGASRCLVEWPERAAGLLGEPDLDIAIGITDSGREVTLRPGTATGRQLLEDLERVEVP